MIHIFRRSVIIWPDSVLLLWQDWVDCCVSVDVCHHHPSVCHMSCSYVAGDDATPDNKAVQQSLAAMLTPYLYRQISKMSTREVNNVIPINAPLTTWYPIDSETVKQ